MPPPQSTLPPESAVRVATRSALTLLELMVVLVILAIVATVAVQSLQPQVDNQRFESASRLLSEIRTASIGPIQKYQVDGTPLISGFVADVGRFPQIQSLNVNLGETSTLSELWDPECELGIMFPFQFRPGPVQPDDYSKVRLPCGWRGPYLQLPIGASSLVDPWGRAPEMIPDVRGELTQLQIMVPVTSTQSEPQPLTTELTTGRVEVTGKILLDNPENATPRAVLLTPDPNSSLTTLTVLDDEDEEPDSFLFRNVPIGLRAVVVDAAGQRQTKYIQVTHNGTLVVFNFQSGQLETSGPKPAEDD